MADPPRGRSEGYSGRDPRPRRDAPQAAGRPAGAARASRRCGPRARRGPAREAAGRADRGAPAPGGGSPRRAAAPIRRIDGKWRQPALWRLVLRPAAGPAPWCPSPASAASVPSRRTRASAVWWQSRRDRRRCCWRLARWAAPSCGGGAPSCGERPAVGPSAAHARPAERGAGSRRSARPPCCGTLRIRRRCRSRCRCAAAVQQAPRHTSSSPGPTHRPLWSP
jgi:hypothetical protein